MDIKKATLVLEGGATRGVFTSGALDYLMEKDVYLSHVIGVSAGACNAVDYVSRQPGRTRDCMIPQDKSGNYYYGLRDFVKERSVMNMDLIFDKYPNEIIPFDFDTYFQSEMKCELVTTNCLTGKAEYMDDRQDKTRLMKICRASCSMPLLTPIVNVDETPYLDGGLADSIPMQRALDRGCDKLVVIASKSRKFVKTPEKFRMMYTLMCRKYPKAVKALNDRYLTYRRQQKLMFDLEKAGPAFLFTPETDRKINTFTMDREVNQHMYDLGVQDFRRKQQKLAAFLKA